MKSTNDRQKKKEYIVRSTNDREKRKERIKDLMERRRYTKYDTVGLSAAEVINSVTWDGTFHLYK